MVLFLRNGIYPMQSAIDKVNRLPDVYLVTGRLETERAKTVATLKKFGVRYKALLMNSQGSDPTSQLSSKRLHAKSIMASNKVNIAVDDNVMAQSMYRALGIGITKGAL